MAMLAEHRRLCAALEKLHNRNIDLSLYQDYTVEALEKFAETLPPGYHPPPNPSPAATSTPDLDAVMTKAGQFYDQHARQLDAAKVTRETFVESIKRTFAGLATAADQAAAVANIDTFLAQTCRAVCGRNGVPIDNPERHVSTFSESDVGRLFDQHAGAFEAAGLDRSTFVTTYRDAPEDVRRTLLESIR